MFEGFFSLREFREQQENARKLDQQKRHAINEISAFESYCFNDLIASDEKMQKVNERGLEEVPTFTELAEDIYAAFYKARPEVNQDKMYKPYQINKQIVEEIMGMEQYTKLRKFTKQDRETSSEVAVEMADLAIKLLSEKQKEKIRQQYEKLMMSAQGQGGENGDSENDDGENESQEQTKGMGQGQAQGEDENDDSENGNGIGLSEEDMKEIAEKLQAQIGKFMDEKIEEEEAKEATVKSFGNEDGQLNTTSYEQAKALYEKVKKSRLLYETVKTVGRMRDIAKKIRTERYIDIREEVIDIEVGNDLSKLLASEFMLFGCDDQNVVSDENTEMTDEELLFLKKFADGELLQYRYRGKEEKGKGPIVLLIDRSGSMSGQNEVWARGVALTLQHIAMEDKRDIHVIYYDYKIFREIFLPKGRPVNPMEWMNFISIGSDGGTSFETPLDRAAEIIEKEAHMKQADIIMISDGGCHVGDDWLKKFIKKKEALNFKCIGILIGMYAEVMEKFCENVVNITDIRKDSEALNTMFQI